MAALVPYPAYRDPSSPWLGPVPSHWGLRSLGSLVQPVTERGRPDLPLLSVVRERGVILRSSMTDDENHNFVPDDLSNYKVVRKGDLVINKMKAWQGSLGVAPCDGIVSPAYFVYHFGMADLRYGQALLRSKPYTWLFARASDGVRIGQWDLSPYELKRIPVFVPPPDEQAAIVRYLGHVDRRIRRYIRAREKLIALLNEQKQAIIHRAVTRGLDANVPLKPSGVEWLGDLPEHWEARRLKHVCRLMYGDSLPDERRTAGDVPVFGSNGPVGKHSMANTRGPCLVVGRKGSFGKVNYSTEPVFAIDTTFVVDGRSSNANCRWLYYILTWSRLDSVTKDSAVPGLDREEAHSRVVPWCPPNEQVLIAESLDATLGHLDRVQAAAAQSIEMIRDYRTRLISDVVTGKLDVRHLAPETEEPPLDEVETLEAALTDGQEEPADDVQNDEF